MNQTREMKKHRLQEEEEEESEEIIKEEGGWTYKSHWSLLFGKFKPDNNAVKKSRTKRTKGGKRNWRMEQGKEMDSI